MNFKCAIGRHDWSKDCEKCAACGKTRVKLHDWVLQLGDSQWRRCLVCNKLRRHLVTSQEEPYHNIDSGESEVFFGHLENKALVLESRRRAKESTAALLQSKGEKSHNAHNYEEALVNFLAAYLLAPCQRTAFFVWETHFSIFLPIYMAWMQSMQYHDESLTYLASKPVVQILKDMEDIHRRAAGRSLQNVLTAYAIIIDEWAVQLIECYKLDDPYLKFVGSIIEGFRFRMELIEMKNGQTREEQLFSGILAKHGGAFHGNIFMYERNLSSMYFHMRDALTMLDEAIVRQQDAVLQKSWKDTEPGLINDALAVHHWLNKYRDGEKGEQYNDFVELMSKRKQ